MLKYSASIVEDYIEGNDIEDFDIDELENDRSFMLDVIKKTKDKNFYNLCSDDLKHDYEFVSALLDMFKDDTKFIVSVADEFVSYFRSESIGPMISDEDERDVLDVLMTICDLIPDKYDKSSFKYRVILSVMISTRLVAIERVRIENEGDYRFTKEFGCGFISVFDSFNSSIKVTDRFAYEFLNNIFSKDYCDLEEYLHGKFNNKEDINKYGLNTILIEIISHFDSMLGSYVSTHMYLLDEYKKDVKRMINKWDSFDDRKNSKMCRKICVAIQDYLEYNYPESDITSSSWIYYIAEKLGITKMFLKFDDLDEEYVKGIVEDMDNIYFDDMKLSELKHLVNMKKIVSDILAGKEVITSYPDFEEEDNQGQTSSCEVVSLDFRKNN